MYKELVESYPELKLRTPSSWIVYNDDLTKCEKNLATFCNAHMRLDGPGMDTLIQALPFDDMDFIDALIDGPFCAYQDKISIETFDGKKFVKCSNLAKWPANVLYNFCIAIRTPLEHKVALKRWTEFVKKGMDRSLALALMFFYSVSADGILSQEGCGSNSNHFFVDYISDTKRFVSGDHDPQRVSLSYKTNPMACLPTNCIWGVYTKGKKPDIEKLSIEAACKLFDVPFKATRKKLVAKIEELNIKEAAKVAGVNPLNELDFEWAQAILNNDGGIGINLAGAPQPVDFQPLFDVNNLPGDL